MALGELPWVAAAVAVAALLLTWFAARMDQPAAAKASSRQAA
jgi:MFS transporter, DHA1 family, inner membrane transport protein